MSEQHPLISCICITSSRSLLLQRALACFETQDYPNKELVISYPENDLATKNLIDQIDYISDIDIIRLERPVSETLGAARNNAIKLAKGKFVCTWDDDDWYSNHRISHQYKVIKDGKFQASICTSIIIFHFNNKRICYSGSRLWEGTLLCTKEALIRHPYSDKEKGEAETVIHQLLISRSLFLITDDSYLYIHIFHGQNSWDENYFNIHFHNSLPLEEPIKKDIEELTSLEKYVL